MKLLIFGGNGWIGNKFCKYLNKSNINYVKSKNRANNINDIKNEIQNYTHIISFIGRTSGMYNGEKISTIDYLEKPDKLNENIRDNLFGPLSLALICKEYGKHFTYLGTGCIFDYDEKNGYNLINGFKEENKPNFFGSSYSIVKGFTDQIMHLLESNVLNLRIRMPISDEKHERNFITKITKYDKICSIPNSMTVLETFFPIFIDMIINNKTGTYNCTNPGTISHNEILNLYKEIVDNNFIWTNFTIEEQNKILLSKRSNNYLNTDKLTSEYNILNIYDAVKETLINYNQNNQVKNIIEKIYVAK